MSLEFELQPGVQAFPGYCLHLPLGRGGCGEVWEASGLESKSIALKFMKVRDTTAATREAKSIQSIRGLRHPYLIRIEQVFLQRHSGKGIRISRAAAHRALCGRACASCDG